MKRWLFPLLLLLASTNAARADLKLEPCLRELLFDADLVIEAEPVERGDPDRFKVTKVLRGEGVKVGEVVRVEGLERYIPEKVEVDFAILFLDQAKEGIRRPLDFGAHLWSRDRRLLRPTSSSGVMALAKEQSWIAHTQRVSREAKVILDLIHRRDLRSYRARNRALLDWIEEHRLSLRQSTVSADIEQSWGKLAVAPFQWVLESGEPRACWESARLYSQVHEEPIELTTPCFGNRSRREMLFNILLDEERLFNERLLALQLLSHPVTLKPTETASLPTQPLTKHEQSEMLVKLLPLIEHPSEHARAVAARGIRDIGNALPLDPALYQKLLFPALFGAYQAEEPGKLRNTLAEVVASMSGPVMWSKISGNEGGTLALLRDLRIEKGKAICWLEVRAPARKLFAQPILIIERVDDKGEVSLRMIRDLELAHIQADWQRGWGTERLIPVEIDLGGLPHGRWRFRAQGTTGSEGQPWTSEPAGFKVDKPNPNNRYPYRGSFREIR